MILFVLAAADDIDERTISYTFGNSTHDSKYKLINIKWDEPINPNGFIISYQIEHRRITTEPVWNLLFHVYLFKCYIAYRFSLSKLFLPFVFLVKFTPQTTMATIWNCHRVIIPSVFEHIHWLAMAIGLNHFIYSSKNQV